jgi:hypothetical protein
MSRIRSVSVAGAILVGILLAGCTPTPGGPVSPTATAGSPTVTPSASATPVPDPTKPAVDELVITPEGLGNIVIGSPIAAVTPEFDAAIFDPDYCAGTDGVDPGKWIANYEPALSGPSMLPFNVFVDEHGVAMILDVRSDLIPTDHGIRIGNTETELRAAYPEGFDARIVRFDGATTLYVVRGTGGQLIYEVFNDDILEDGSYLHQVAFIHVLTRGEEPYGFANTDAGWGGCVHA